MKKLAGVTAIVMISSGFAIIISKPDVDLRIRFLKAAICAVIFAIGLATALYSQRPSQEFVHPVTDPEYDLSTVDPIDTYSRISALFEE